MSDHPDSLKYEDVPWGEIAQHEASVDCEHEFENTYPMRECLLCGLIEDSPEPIYDDEG